MRLVRRVSPRVLRPAQARSKSPCGAGPGIDVDDSIEAACRAAEAAALEYRDDGQIAKFVRLSVRYEQALHADDVIARRLRVESLDRRAAARLTPRVHAALSERSTVA